MDTLEPDTPTPRVLRIRAVSALVGLAPSTIYEYMRKGKFPRPDAKYPGVRTALWRASTVERWLDEMLGDAQPAA